MFTLKYELNEQKKYFNWDVNVNNKNCKKIYISVIRD